MHSVKFVRQVHMPLAPLVQTGTLQQRAYTALMNDNTRWARCPDGLTSILPKNDPLQIGCSQRYDAFKYGADCVAASGSQGMWAGMAAYRFQLPDDVMASEGKDAARLLKLAVGVFTDKFLLGGVAVSAGFSVEAEPDAVGLGLLDPDNQPFPLPYTTKVDGAKSPVMGDLAAGSAEGTNKYETLTLFDSVVEGGSAALPVPDAGRSVYLWVFIRLFNYTELKWEYWIEGSAGLDADTLTVTWDRDVEASAYTQPNYDLAYNRILPVETTWCNRSGCKAGWFKYTVTADDTPACLRPGHYSSTTLEPENPYPDAPADVDTRVMLDNLMYFHSSANRAVAFTIQDYSDGNGNYIEYMNYSLGADNWKYRLPSMKVDLNATQSYWGMGEALVFPASQWTRLDLPGEALNIHNALNGNNNTYPAQFMYVPDPDGTNWHMVAYAYSARTYNGIPILGAWMGYHSKWDDGSAGGCWVIVEALGDKTDDTTNGAHISWGETTTACVLTKGDNARIVIADFFKGSWFDARMRTDLAYWEHTDAANKAACKDQVFRAHINQAFTQELLAPTLTELADGTILVAGCDWSMAYDIEANGGAEQLLQESYDAWFGPSALKGAYIVNLDTDPPSSVPVTAPMLPHTTRPTLSNSASSCPMSPSLLMRDGRALLLDWMLVRPSTECVTTFDEAQQPIYTPPSTTAQQIIEYYDATTMTWGRYTVSRDMLGENAYQNASPGRSWKGVLLPDGNVFMYGDVMQVKRTLVTLNPQISDYTYGRDAFGGVRRAWCIFDAATSTMSEFNFVGVPYSCNASVLLMQDQVTILFAEAGSMHTFNTVTHVWTQLGNSPGYVGRGRMFAPPAVAAEPSTVDVDGCRVVTSSIAADRITVTAECVCRRIFAYVPGQFKPSAVRLRINPVDSTNTAARILIVADTRDIKADAPLADAGRIKAYYSGILDPADTELGLTVVGQAMVPFAGAGSTLDIAISELPKGRNSLWLVIMPTGTWGQGAYDANGELERFEVQISKTLLVGASE